MDFGLLRFLAFAMILKLPKTSIGENVTCQALSFIQDFPGYLVPDTLQFMLFYINSLEAQDIKIINKRHSCLDGSNTFPQIQHCNVKEVAQKWFQYQSSLINIKSGLSLLVKKTSVAFGLWENISLPWKCNLAGSTILFSLSVTGTGSNRRYLGRSGPNGVVLQSTSDKMWGMADVNGTVIENFDLPCKERAPFCGSILPGLNSFLVSSATKLTNYLNVPENLIKKAISTGIKPCYSGGDFILQACMIGNSDIKNSRRYYSSAVCLGDGEWSNPEPLDCVPVNCGKFPSFENAAATPLSQMEKYSQYGDVVLYDCMGFYQGPQGSLACGYDGRWEGLLPTCIHICHAELTYPNGTITTPNYPNPYPQNIECKWTIKVKVGLKIALFFLDFSTEHGSIFYSSCRYDVLTIRDPFEGDSTKFFCGKSHPEVWISEGNILFLSFISDKELNDKGFWIEYCAWNESESSEPQPPFFNLTRFGEQPYLLNTGNANYAVEIIYVILVILLIFIIMIVAINHIIFRVKRKIHPVDEQSAPPKKNVRVKKRRNAIAQCDSESEIEKQIGVKEASNAECLSEYSETFLRSMSSQVDEVKLVKKYVDHSKQLSLPDVMEKTSEKLSDFPSFLTKDSKTTDLVEEALNEMALECAKKSRAASSKKSDEVEKELIQPAPVAFSSLD